MPGSFRSGRTLSSSSVRRGSVGSANKFGGGKFGRTTSNNNTGSGQQLTTGADRFRKQSPWGPIGKSPWSGMSDNFRKAIFGDSKQKNVGTPDNNKKDNSKLPKDLLGMKIKVDSSLKGDKVKYNYRKNTVSIGSDQELDRKKLPKQLAELAKSSKGFRDTTGLGTISGRDRRQLNSALRRKRLRLERANKKLHSSSTSRSRSKSVRRKVTFGDLVK